MDFEMSSENGALRVAEGGRILFESGGCPLPDGVSASSETRENELRVFVDPPVCEAMRPFGFPAAIIPEAGDILLIPHFEGFRIKADDVSFPISERLYASGTGLSMAFYGILRRGYFLLCAIYTNLDAELLMEKRDRLFAPRVEWLPEKGKGGYRREIRYIAGKGGISELCAKYREIAGEKGFRKTFDERAKENPGISRLVGAANVWLWNDDAMDKLYSENAVYHVPTAAQNAERVRIAREMKEAGMDHVLWSVFDENVDKGTVDEVKKLGYLTTFYDIYTDVIPHEIENLIPDTRRERCKLRRDCYPDGIMRNADGTMQKAWQLKGKDGEFHFQNRICDAAALECASKVVPGHSEKYGLEGRFLDVQCVSAGECYDERHPMTRRTSFDYKRGMFDMLHKNKLIAGTEVGCEDAAAGFDYDEGMLSPVLARQYDAGRRMTHIYEGDAIEPKIREIMLNPKYRVPLWELVYHGCVQSYWYWGDSTNCMPELMRLRDKFCELWGLPAIYSFRVSDWERLRPMITESYQRTTPSSRRLWSAAMTGFEWLDDEGLIQRTTFSDGTVITVDFSGDIG